MFTTGSKLLIGGTVLAAVAAVVYGLTQDGALGTVGLSFAAVALGLVAGINVYARDADVSAMDQAAVVASPAARPAPGRSVWPMAAALGATLVVIGVVTFPVVVVFGVIVLVATTIEWMVQAWSERASADAEFNTAVRSRIAHPLEFPLLAAVAVGIIIYSFSRIMLFLSKSNGPIAFATIAALILVAGFVFAFRPSLRSGAITGVASIAALGLVAGGVAAALDGERESERHETTADLGRDGGCTAEETEADENASQTVAAKASITAEVVLRSDESLVAHNLGIAGDSDTVVVSRSNATNVRFRNESDEPRRLVLELADPGAETTETTAAPTTAAAGEGDSGEEGGAEAAPKQRCTALVDEGGSQLMTFSLTTPSSARTTPYQFLVPGIDGASIEVVVP